ncbi:hypothetical protein ACQ4PT_028831 [Festuca glaucescens]
MDDAGETSQPPLTIRISRAASGGGADAWPAVAEEPVSPTARLMDSFYIVVTMGLGSPLDLPVFRAGIETQLARYPRFRSIQVTKDGKPRWVRAPALNLDDHIIVVPSRPDMVSSSDPDRAVEDYVASLSTAPMDRSRPLWEFHFLDFPTSDAMSTAVFRVHHSLGDGMSLLTILMASTRSAADPSRLPAMPAPPARSGDIYARPRPPRTAGVLALIAWLWSFVVLAWHTVVDVTLFVATIAFVRDPHTLFKRDNGGGDGELPRRKRFVNRSLSLGDVKFLKEALNCALTVHYQSYSNTIKVILAVDEEQFPDHGQLLDDFTESLRIIKDGL